MKASRRVIFTAGLIGACLSLPFAAYSQSPARELRAGTSMAANHPSAQVLKKLSENLAQMSGGRLGMKVFTDATLGGDGQMQQQVQAGLQDISTAPLAGLASQVKELSTVEFPFTYRNSDEFYAVLEGPMGEEIRQKLYEKGWYALGYSHNGFRHTTNTRRPITKWEDFQGIKIRVIPNAMYIDLFKALGANPTPMAVSEVFTALETKAVDAQESPLAQIGAMKIFEVQTYLSLTRHSVNSEVLLLSRKTWDSLPPGDKEILQKATKSAIEWKRKAFAEIEGELLETIKKAGMKINEVSDAEIQRMAEQLKPVIEKHSEVAGRDFAQRYMAAVEKVRAGN